MHLTRIVFIFKIKTNFERGKPLITKSNTIIFIILCGIVQQDIIIDLVPAYSGH